MKEGENEGEGEQETLAALRLENRKLKKRLQEQTQLTLKLAKSVSLAAGPVFPAWQCRGPQLTPTSSCVFLRAPAAMVMKSENDISLYETLCTLR